jgi:hypothetical protein
MAKEKVRKEERLPRKRSMNPGGTVKLWKRKFFFDVIIFLAAFVLFANSIPNEYNLDDELVTINHRLTSKGVAAIPDI